MSDAASTKSVVPHGEPEMTGWLFKWTNYLKGYQRRWFVLQNGVLSYYRAENNGGPKLSIRRRRRYQRQGNQAEMSHTCRGNISLHGALIHAVDSCAFVISNGGAQMFHIKAANEVERQSWLTALELAKGRAIDTMESEDEDEEERQEAGNTSEELITTVRSLVGKLESMNTCQILINKHGAGLQRLLVELEQPDLEQLNVQAKSKAIGERATLFRVACNAMINACTEYQDVAQNHGHKWVRMLQHEREQRQRLEDMVEQLARQHSHLEMAATAHASGSNGPVVSPSDDEEDNEFYDCVTDGSSATTKDNGNPEDNSFVLNIPLSGGQHRRNSSDSSGEEGTGTQQVLFVTKQAEGAQKDGGQSMEADDANRPENAGKRARRQRVADKPNYPLNLWSIMKNCIGKDLSKIPMPVNFSEPLSMLQRLTEDYEYAEVLDAAARCEDPCEQLAYVAAFTVSSYSTTANRTGKPFNPLLGETYECDRTDDLGWRAISEQVSHHPPMVAQYCEGANWRCWQEFTMTSKFRGKYLQVIPMGTAHVEFIPSGNKYSWRKVTTTVHNIIVGKLWVDHHGDMEIMGRGGKAHGIHAHLKYIPYSYFTRDGQRRVKGCVMDSEKQARWTVTGTWDHKVDIAPVIGHADSHEGSVYQTGPALTAWKRRMPPTDCDRYYGFTTLAAQLNEPEEGVCPTDSRLRPDQRLMEVGRWDEANAEKVRLEEKQRTARRRREAEAEEAAKQGRPYPPYEPLWFTRRKEDDSDTITHVYKDTYWQSKKRQEWTACPDIF